MEAKETAWIFSNFRERGRERERAGEREREREREREEGRKGEREGGGGAGRGSERGRETGRERCWKLFPGSLSFKRSALFHSLGNAESRISLKDERRLKKTFSYIQLR